MSMQHAIPDLNAKELRQFAFTMSAVICILFGLVLPFLLEHSWPKWPWVIGAIFVSWGVLAPISLRPIYHVWMRFGLIMSKIITPLILGILYFLVITPFGIVMRIFNKDPLARNFDKTKSTYRVHRDESIPTDFERPY